MRTSLAWANITHNRARTLVALGGVTTAIHLIFVQLGFLGSCARSATLLHDLMSFDLVLVSPQYTSLRSPASFPRRRLQQAASVTGVASVTAMRVGSTAWRNPESGQVFDLMALGVSPDSRPFVLDALTRQVPTLTRDDEALAERTSHQMIGPHGPGTVVEVGGRRMRIAGDYAWGTGFNALGALVVNESAFAGIVPGAVSDARELGLVQLASGAEAADVKRGLAAVLPDDVRVLTRDEIADSERAYWVRTKPIGIMFSSGVVLAFLVGTGILFQLLSSEINNHLREYATLKAIGYRPGDLRATVMVQGALLALLGFLPAALLSWLVYHSLRASTNLPIEMTAARLLMVLVMSVGMCAVSGLLAIRRVTMVDPAELF